MAELIVVGFKKDMYRASEVLNTLQEMHENWVVDLNDAVAVYRDYSGKLRVDQSYQMTTGEGAAWGGLFGGLIGAMLAAPFTGGASAAARSRGWFAERRRARCDGRRARCGELERGLRHLGRLRPASRHDGAAGRLRDLRAAAQPRPGSRGRAVQGLRRHHPPHDA